MSATHFYGHKNLTKLTLTLSTAILLAACGGGGGGGGSSTPVTPPTGGGSSGPTWTPGTFAPASSFKNLCETPRTAPDINGNAYPDRAGSTTEENFWLRSWSDETYLWYDEITDRNPASYSDRLEYFDLLRTTATTPSGTPRDQFHFTIPTDEYEQRVVGGSTASYGADFAFIQTSPPRDIRIAYTDPNTPASENNAFIRGSKILEIDGVDAVNGGATQADLDILNNGLRPATAGESHEFVVQDPGSTETRTVTLVSADLAIQPVNSTQVIDTPTGKVGYIHFTTFGTRSAEEAIYNSMLTLDSENVTDLVLDLRYNGGGFLAIAGQIGYMIAGDARTDGRIFDNLVFNDKHPTINPVTGDVLSPTPFYDEILGFAAGGPTPGTSLPSLNLNRVFILTTDDTCSASEAVMNGLRGVDVEVVQIGTRTCGKPYGFYATDNCGETYFTVQFRGENDKGFGDYADGFQAANGSTLIGESVPGCEISDDFDNQLGSNSEALLAAALQYREDGTCPAGSSKIDGPDLSKAQLSDGLDLMSNRNFALDHFFKTSRIENLPAAPLNNEEDIK